jgi:hypothetical protein
MAATCTRRVCTAVLETFLIFTIITRGLYGYRMIIGVLL